MKLQRDYHGADCTLGQLLRDDGSPMCQTLELPWRDNHAQVSCIPAGQYTCALKFSPSHGYEVYWINGVPNRGAIEIHVGNTAADSKGCVLVGQARGHLGDQNAVLHSRAAFDAMMIELNGAASFPLEVTDP